MLNNSPRLSVAASVALTLFLSLGSPTHAGYVVNVSESGGNVVATGSGTVILSVGGPDGGGIAGAFINPAGDSLLLGAVAQDSSHDGQTYHLALDSAPAAFGTGVFSAADSATGDYFGVQPSGNPNYLNLTVGFGYTSGSYMSSSATWDNASFSSLGLTSGTYVWTWGSGADADSFTMNIGVSSVPEPASLMMLGTGSLATLGFTRRRRRPEA